MTTIDPLTTDRRLATVRGEGRSPNVPALAGHADGGRATSCVRSPAGNLGLRALHDADAGRPAALERALAHLEPLPHGALESRWAAVLRCQRALLGLDLATGDEALASPWGRGFPEPLPDGRSSDEERHVWFLAAWMHARRALATLDATAILKVAAAIDRAGPPPDEQSAIRAAAIEIYVDVIVHGASNALAEAEAVQERASRCGLAPLVVELCALRALATLAAGDLSQGLRHARRAVRMARAEGGLVSDALTRVVLARARRMHGLGFLALHILRDPSSMPPAWSRWLEWERALAGEPSGDEPLARAVARVAEAAATGDYLSFELAIASLMTAVGGVELIGEEARALTDLLDPARPLGAVEPRALGFLAGQSSHAPFGLHCMWNAGGGPVGWVVVRPDAGGRRVLGPGIHLVGRGARFVPPVGRGQRRLDTAAAVLGLAGPEGLSDLEFFEQVYGFAGEEVARRGILDVLLHRLRGHLHGLADITRRGPHIVLTAKAEIVVVDPRCEPDTRARLLRQLARTSDASARDLAGTLGIPTRTTQDALKELVRVGVCTVERIGRRVRYRLEDTTFRDPA